MLMKWVVQTPVPNAIIAAPSRILGCSPIPAPDGHNRRVVAFVASTQTANARATRPRSCACVRHPTTRSMDNPLRCRGIICPKSYQNVNIAGAEAYFCPTRGEVTLPT